MSIPIVANAEYPTPQEMLAGLLSEYRYGYNRIGVTVNVAKGTEPYIRYQALANRLSIAIENNRLALADISPLDAAGDALEELCSTYGVARRPASFAAGLVKVATTAATLIPSGYQCTAPNGMQYRTTTAVVVVAGDNVAVQAVTTGTTSNIASGTVLTWDSAALSTLNQNCTVTSGGIDGGTEEDTDEELRQRLIRRLSFPQVGGNTAQVAGFAEDASSAVQAAFVYPAARGPGSYDVALVAEGTDTDNDRALNSVTVNNVASAILGNMPGNADLNCTTVAEQRIDVIMALSLPLPINAGGAGGGWRDAVPWPSTLSTDAGVLPRVTAFNSGTFTVNTTVAPGEPPQTAMRFGIWDPLTFTMHEYTVAGPIGGGSGAYTFTTTGGNTSWLENLNLTTNYRYLSAGCVNLASYADEYLSGVRLLGPGEKTTSVDILPRGRRNPPPDVLWPTDINTRLTTVIYSAHEEVTNINYIRRYEANTTTVRSAPSAAATTADLPRILTLSSLAFIHQR